MKEKEKKRKQWYKLKNGEGFKRKITYSLIISWMWAAFPTSTLWFFVFVLLELHFIYGWFLLSWSCHCRAPEMWCPHPLPSLACHCRCFGKRDTTFSARSLSSSYPCKKWLVLPNSQTEKALDFVTCVNCQSSRKHFPFRVPVHGVCPLSLLMDPSKRTWTICPTWWEKSLAAVVVVCDSSFINSADTEEHLVTTNKRTA